MMKLQQPKTVLCIHDLSALGRAGLSAIVPVLSAAGIQPIPLPTAVLSSHTGGLGQPAAMRDGQYGSAALAQYQQLGLEFDYIYSGYLAAPEQTALVLEAHRLWPKAFLLVDPVLGDGGKLYSGFGPESVAQMRTLCGQAGLILPNCTEAALLLDQEPAQPGDDRAAMDLACRVQQATGAKSVVVTGLELGKDLACAGSDFGGFLVRKQHLSRSFPGTGDLFGAVLLTRLALGNALSAAVDMAAAFVADSILATPPEADPRLGVWYEPLLGRICTGGQP